MKITKDSILLDSEGQFVGLVVPGIGPLLPMHDSDYNVFRTWRRSIFKDWCPSCWKTGTLRFDTFTSHNPITIQYYSCSCGYYQVRVFVTKNGRDYMDYRNYHFGCPLLRFNSPEYLELRNHIVFYGSQRQLCQHIVWPIITSITPVTPSSSTLLIDLCSSIIRGRSTHPKVKVLALRDIPRLSQVNEYAIGIPCATLTSALRYASWYQAIPPLTDSYLRDILISQQDFCPESNPPNLSKDKKHLAILWGNSPRFSKLIKL